MREANECNPRSLSLCCHMTIHDYLVKSSRTFLTKCVPEKNGLLATVHCTWSSTSDKSRETSGRYYHSVWCLCGMTGLKSIKTLKRAQRRCRPDKENLLNLDWKIMLKLSVENQFSAPVVVVRLWTSDEEEGHSTARTVELKRRKQKACRHRIGHVSTKKKDCFPAVIEDGVGWFVWKNHANPAKRDSTPH